MNHTLHGARAPLPISAAIALLLTHEARVLEPVFPTRRGRTPHLNVHPHTKSACPSFRAAFRICTGRLRTAGLVRPVILLGTPVVATEARFAHTAPHVPQANNTRKQSPCDVAVLLARGPACANDPGVYSSFAGASEYAALTSRAPDYFATALDGAQDYYDASLYGQTAAPPPPCMCTGVMYTLWAACGDCQYSGAYLKCVAPIPSVR
jgi:hypothetical protein